MAENNNILAQLQDLVKNTKINDLVKDAEAALQGDSNNGNLKNLSKVLNMLKSVQGGKIFGKLGQVAGLSSLMSAAEKFQNSSENTENQENMLDELDAAVAVAIEDGILTDDEIKMLSEKAAALGLNVEEFIAEVRQKCENQ